VLGAILRHEDRVLEDELSDLRMFEHLAPHAARRHLVKLPPFAELGARLLKSCDQVLEVGIADVACRLGSKVGLAGVAM
jgi:hypothetical protein